MQSILVVQAFLTFIILTSEEMNVQMTGFDKTMNNPGY